MLIEPEEVGDRQRQRRWQRASWTHRAGVIAVAAAIVVVFFVPLPHVSLFHSLVTPAKVTAPTNSLPLTSQPHRLDGCRLPTARRSYPFQRLGGSSTTSCPTGSSPGEVLVNPANTYCPAFGQGGPKNVVWLVSRSYVGFRPSSSDKRSVINGFSVYDDRGTYFVPSLGLQVTLSGPLAQRVLHTLSRSPRAVALAPVRHRWSRRHGGQ